MLQHRRSAHDANAQRQNYVKQAKPTATTKTHPQLQGVNNQSNQYSTPCGDAVKDQGKYTIQLLRSCEPPHDERSPQRNATTLEAAIAYNRAPNATARRVRKTLHPQYHSAAMAL